MKVLTELFLWGNTSYAILRKVVKFGGPAVDHLKVVAKKRKGIFFTNPPPGQALGFVYLEKKLLIFIDFRKSLIHILNEFLFISDWIRNVLIPFYSIRINSIIFFH